MTVNTQKPIVIFRGDNTAAFDLRTITILLTGDLDLTNATARFDLLGFTKSWTTEEVATGELSIVFDSAQTKAFALGPQTGTLRLFDMSTGTPRQLTVVNKIPFFVTNNVCEIDSQSYGVNVRVTSGETIHIEFNVGLDAVEGKADKVEGATAGDLASLTEDGNLEDSGIPANGVQRKLTFDDTPTEGSQNPVTSDGIKRALDAATPEDYEQVKSQVEQNTRDIGTNTENIGKNAGDIADNARDIATNAGDIAAIEAKIPAQASAQNQLADKDFVNSSIATNTATFRGSYNLVSDLGLTVSATEQQVAAAIAAKLASLVPPVVPENNDYCFVQVPKTDADPTVIERIDRYKCTVTESGGVTTRVWEYEWSLNNSSFTADQWAAINSGITSALVTKLGALPTAQELSTALLAKYEKPSTGIPKTDLASGVQASLDKADTAFQKPSGGIPKTDLASGVQSSLDKADTALQSAPVTSVNSKTGAVSLSASDVGVIVMRLTDGSKDIMVGNESVNVKNIYLSTDQYGNTVIWLGVEEYAVIPAVDLTPKNHSPNAVSSGGVYAALALLAPLASPAFTGTPTAPNLTNQSADGQVANKKYVDDKVAGVSVTPLSGQTFDFATMQGIFAGVKACIEALGGSVTNFPAIPAND